MPHPIEPSTLRILKTTGETVGTGFLVSKDLIVTCAHVVAPNLDVDGRVLIQFTGQKQRISVTLLDEYFSPEHDVALLQIDEPPGGVLPLRLAASSVSRAWNRLYSFGYATTAGETGLGSLGTFVTQKTGGNYIQFDSPQVDHGFSGAPLFDENLKVVIGMINMGNNEAGRNQSTTFAIPTETIWQVCPQLKPPTIILPHRNPIVDGINLLPYDYDQRIQNFLTEYLGTDSHPVPFGGRDEALKMLDGWLAETTPYLLLAAPAGRGKSALLVRWLDSLKVREDLALAFVPVSIRFGTNMERVFYAALAARLAFLHGDDVPASPETSTAVYRGLVADYLSKPLANGRTLLVALDGLDEAADWQAGADFMPGELPAGVRVVVSARFLAGDADSTNWLRRLNWERNGLASAPSLTPLDRAGVADVLLKMGCPLDELGRKVDIVAELYRLSAGDPLLVGLYVGDLWNKRETVTRLKPEELAGIQPGYKGYFDRWWEDQKKLWGREKPWLEKHVRAVRNLLAGALGPLFRDDFQALDPELESDYIADALDVLQRFIIGDNQTQGYTFSHPKLGQYFWEALTPSEQAQVEERFLTWCDQIFQEFIDGKRDPKKKADVPTYVVRNYGAHLAYAKQPIESWLLLIHHQQWAQAWFTVEGAYGGYLQDVQHVWEFCKLVDRQAVETTGKAPNIGAQIRCNLIETSLHSLSNNISPELVTRLVRTGIWTLQQAWVFIRQMSEPEKQAEAILNLIRYISTNQLSGAVESARTIKDNLQRAKVLSTLTQSLPEISLESFKATLDVEDEEERAKILNILIPYLSEENLYQIIDSFKFKSRLDDILDTLARTRALSALAKRQQEINSETLARLQEIDDESSHASVMKTLAVRLPDKDLSKLLELARAIRDPEDRADVLCALVQRLPEISTEALSVAQEAEAQKKKLNNLFVHGGDCYLATLARYLPKEYLPKMLDMAQTERDDWRKDAYWSILAERVTDNDLPKILEMVQTTKYYSLSALIVLAQRLPKAELSHVLKIALEIENESGRAELLSALSEQIPYELLSQILDAANIMTEKEARVQVLGALAERIPEMWARTLELIWAIDDDESDLADLLSALLPYLPNQYFYQILEYARAMDDKFGCIKILGALAQNLPEVGSEAIKLAKMLKYRNSPGEALVILAQRLPEENISQVLESLRIIDYGEYRAEILKTLVKRFPKFGAKILEEIHFDSKSQMSEFYLTDVLIAAAAWLTNDNLPKILKIAKTIKDKWCRDEANFALKLRFELSCPPKEIEYWWAEELDRQNIALLNVMNNSHEYRDLLEMVEKTVREEFDRTKLLVAFARYRLKNSKNSLELTQRLLKAALALEQREDRADVLIALMQPILEFRKGESYWIIETSFRDLAYHTRSNLFHDVSNIIPVIIHLGTDDTPREIYAAVRDVTTWWP